MHYVLLLVGYDGRIVKTAGKELVLELEKYGYDWIKQEVESGK